MVELVPPRQVLLSACRLQARVWTDAEYDPNAPERGGRLGVFIQLCEAPDDVVGAEVHAPKSAIA